MRVFAVFAALVVVTASSLASPAAHAGYYMEQEMVISNPQTGAPIKGTIKTWREGDHFKKTGGPTNEVVLLDMKKKEVVGVNDAAKTYWKMSTARYAQIAALALVAMGVVPKADGSFDVPDPMFVPTGETAVIEGKKVRKVKIAAQLPQGLETELWIGDDLPINSDTMIEELKLVLGDPKGASYQALFAQLATLKGYPVQQVTSALTAKGRLMSSQTLLTYREMKVDASEFVVPKGYTLTEDPITMMERMAAAQRGSVGVGAPLKATPKGPGTLPPPDPK